MPTQNGRFPLKQGKFKVGVDTADELGLLLLKTFFCNNGRGKFSHDFGQI
jgi:hypothetical protein